jgi:hypothetical protein
MAIGQLTDYARLVKPTPAKLILVPQKPGLDLLRLAENQGIKVAWRTDEGEFEFSRQLIDIYLALA